ncbi:MAG: protein kinase [Gammaproteobacteria bacterium]
MQSEHKTIATGKNLESNTSINYSRIHPEATANDFHPNGKILSDAQIQLLNIKLKNENKDAVYSKKYLQHLGVSIDRGSIVRIKDETGRFILYAVYKTEFTRKAKILGKGSFAKVKVLQNLETGDFDKVLKVLTNPSGKQNFQAEALINDKLGRGSKHVLKKKMSEGTVRKNKWYMLQNRVMGKDFYDCLINQNPLPAEQFDMTLKAFKCIQALHAKGKVHRDIKIENMMYDSFTGTVKEIDLAMAQKIGAPFDEILGTEGCIAPEIRIHEKKYSPASDVYALGRLVQEVFGIFASIDIRDEKIEFGGCCPRSKYNYTLAEFVDIKNLAKKMLCSNPEARLSLDLAYIELEGIQFRFNQTRLKAKKLFSDCVKDLKDLLKNYLNPNNHKSSGALFKPNPADTVQVTGLLKIIDELDALQPQDINADPLKKLNKLRGMLKVVKDNLTESYLVTQIDKIADYINQNYPEATPNLAPKFGMAVNLN